MKNQHFTDLYTEEGENLSRTFWNSYPRPQMKRDSFINLNGEWDFCTSANPDIQVNFDEKIIVPFAPQSILSKVHRYIPEEKYLFYKKTFSFNKADNKKVLLHIGAADQIATVWLNGFLLGEHSGGYLPFSFDVTSVIDATNELIIRIEDRMSSFVLPYGKQSAKRGGMWYTPVSGLWQTVWLEVVPEEYISGIDIETGTDYAKITLCGNICEGTIKVHTPNGTVEKNTVKNSAAFTFKEPRMWTPDDPYLYRFEVVTEKDRVESYFALRTLTTEKIGGIPRLCLNGKPFFFHGLLDQGYWSDGIFTPASPECYEKDILAAKSLGFNTLRKHIKIEPEQFYYDCDRLGMIVFQDMVNNSDYNFIRDTALPTVGIRRISDKNLHKNKETRKAFIDSMEQTVLHLKNHPCICYWTVFNEGWGQFEGTKAYRLLKKIDPSRFIDTASGWFYGCESDVVSEHCYFKPFRPKKSEKPLVLSEFGGYAYAPKEHLFNPDNEYGYKKYKSRNELASGIIKLYENEIIPSVQKGLCGTIYTQLSDVEDETNGILSFDRKVQKLLPEEFLSVSQKIYEEINK